MSQKPLVTVIVPTMNSARTLEACLASARAQANARIELIVVDNPRTTDDTRLVAGRYADAVVIKGPERCSQRNEGARIAKGEFVAFIDSDMTLTPDVVAACVKRATERGVVGVVIPEQSHGFGFWAQCKRLERSFYEGVDWIEAARFFRKDSFDAVGGYDESLVSGEDWDLAQRIAARGRIERCRPYILHDEGTLSLGATLKKKWYYAQKFSVYTAKGEHARSVAKQTGVLGRYALFFAKPKKLFANPLLGLGMLFMKTCEFAVGAAAMLTVRLAKPLHAKSQRRSPRRIYLLDNFALNAGDVGILMSMVEGVRRVIPDSSITLETSHPSAIGAYAEFASCAVYPRVFDVQKVLHGNAEGWHRLRAKAVSVYDAGSFLAWALLTGFGLPVDRLVRPSRRKQAVAMRTSDAVVSVGGGFLMTLYSHYAARLYGYVLGMLLRKPVFILGQTVGPFESAVSRVAIPAVIRRCALVCVREPDSYRYVQQFHLGAKLHLTADVAFLLTPTASPIAVTSKKTVAFCVRGKADATMSRAYREAMIMAGQRLTAEGYAVVVVSQTVHDDLIAEEVAAACGGAELVRFGANPRALMALYGSCEFIVASRMHAIVFAIGAGVPFIAIGYERKFNGLIEMLGYDTALLVSFADVDAEAMRAALDRVMSVRQEMARRIADRLDMLKGEALRNFTLLADALDERERENAEKTDSAKSPNAKKPVMIVISQECLPSLGGKQMSVDRIVRLTAERGVCDVEVIGNESDPTACAAFDATYPFPVFRVRSRLIEFGRKFQVGKGDETLRFYGGKAGLSLAQKFGMFFNGFVRTALLVKILRRRLRAHVDTPVILNVHDFTSILAALVSRRLDRRPGRIRVVFVQGYVNRKSGFWPVDVAMRWLLRSCDRILCVSQAAADALIQDFATEVARTQAYRLWFEMNSVPSVPLREYAQPLRVVVVGMIVPGKGIRDVIALARYVEQKGMGDRYHFTVIGDSDHPIREDLRTAVSQTKCLTWLGQLRKHEVLNRLVEQDLLLMPSRWAEGSGNVVVEAGACGLAVVAANVGGIPENARLLPFHRIFDSYEPEVLAEQLSSMSREVFAAGRNDVVVAQRTAIEAHFSEKNFDVHERAYRELFADAAKALV